MEILIVGAGLVGSALGERAGSRAVVARSRDADIRDAGQVRALLERHRPEWVVLSAALSNVDRCQREPELAWSINVRGAENVAQAARDAGARLLFLSTDYVFDGEADAPYETDAPRRPVNVYGETKVAAEDALTAILPRCTIARTSWVFGVHRPCFGTWVLEQARKAGELPVVADKFTCPTYNRDLADMLLGLIEGGAEGLFHACNTGRSAWLELATELLRAWGSGPRLKPISRAEMNWAAPRPRFTAMSVASLEKAGIHPRNWQDAVPPFVEEMRARSGVAG